MASKIVIKRSVTAAAPAGLSYGEMAFIQGSGLTANQFYVGISGGNPVWVGAQIGTTGTWTDNAAKTSLATQYATDQRRISSSVSSFNGLTGAVTGASLGANTFTGLNTFSVGISASGATFTGLISGATATFSKDISVNSLTIGVGNDPLNYGVHTYNTAIGYQALLNTNGDEDEGEGVYNTAVGRYSLRFNTTGSNNTGLGLQSLYSNTTGSSNTGLGVYSLYSNTTGSSNTGLGVQSLYSNTTGSSNTGLGVYSLFSNTTGLNNTGLGVYSLFSNTTGPSNTGLGVQSLYSNTTGSNNNGLGVLSLYSNTTGSSNVGVGQNALFSNTTGSGNIGVGYGALNSNTTGSNKTAIGYLAGTYRGSGVSTLTTGTGGIYIGYQARGSTLAQTNEIVIGVDALGLGSNTAVIGATLQSAATIYGVLNLPSGLSASGATFTGNISAPNIVTVGTANTFTALNSFNAGISASALTVSGTITSTQGITFGSGTTFMAFVPKTAINGGGLWLRDGLFQVGGGVFAANNGNLQYNMNSERFFVYGHQIIDNAAPYQGTTTPLTVKGGTGQSVPLFNVTRGGTSAVQVHQDGYLAIPVNTAPAIKIGDHASKNLTLASIDSSGEIVQTGAANSSLNIRQESGGVVSIGDYVGTNNNTYIEVNDVASTIVLNAGEIYLNGGISTPLVLANAESIQNTVNGRIDFMPGPTAAGAYGLYADVANWGYGVQMGTINSAGTIDSSPGGILFMDRVTFLQDKFISFASDGTHGLVYTEQGLNTLQIGVYPGVANSNAVAIVGTDFTGTTNRSPVTSHTNPNLYVYRAGTTGANDFIRIEHDGTNGNIVAGGTSGIKISGLLDVASGLSASGATFSGDIRVNSMTVGRGGGGDYRNTAVGNGALLENTGIGNAGMGTYALGANTSGSNKTAIGYAAGYYRGSGLVSTLTTGTGGIYIGYQARGSTNGQTNEIVIGVDALGLGSNTAVIGATLQSAATIYGVLNLPSGLSAAGATFSAPISSTRMARHTSAAISAIQTADFTPTAAQDGTVFYINYNGKAMTVTLDALPIGWRAKFLNVGNGIVSFTTTGDIYGEGSYSYLGNWLMEAICIDTNTYFVG